LKPPISNQKKLLKQLKKGNTNAYTQLVDLFYKSLCDYASNLTRDQYGFEDMVQNVIIKLWQRRKILDEDFNLKSYLYRSVYNEFIDNYRRSSTISILEKKYFDGVELYFNDNDEEENKRLLVLIDEEIDKLPEKCKKTFLLSKKEGLSYLEIAEFRNVSVNTVEKQMVKAYAIIRKKIKDKACTFMILLLGSYKYQSIFNKTNIQSIRRRLQV